MRPRLDSNSTSGSADRARIRASLEEISLRYQSLTTLLLKAVADSRECHAEIERRLSRLEQAVFGKAG